LEKEKEKIEHRRWKMENRRSKNDVWQGLVG
jgi:hypothetical protein